MDPSTFQVFKNEGNYLDKDHVAVPCNIDPLGKLNLLVQIVFNLFSVTVTPFICSPNSLTYTVNCYRFSLLVSSYHMRVGARLSFFLSDDR
jgi:hypothetical protein